MLPVGDHYARASPEPASKMRIRRSGRRLRSRGHGLRHQLDLAGAPGPRCRRAGTASHRQRRRARGPPPGQACLHWTCAMPPMTCSPCGAQRFSASKSPPRSAEAIRRSITTGASEKARTQFHCFRRSRHRGGDIGSLTAPSSRVKIALTSDPCSLQPPPLLRRPRPWRSNGHLHGVLKTVA